MVIDEPRETLQKKLKRAIELLSQASNDREIYRPDMETEERLQEYDELSDAITKFIDQK